MFYTTIVNIYILFFWQDRNKRLARFRQYRHRSLQVSTRFLIFSNLVKFLIRNVCKLFAEVGTFLNIWAMNFLKAAFGSFSAVSAPIFASNGVFSSIFFISEILHFAAVAKNCFLKFESSRRINFWFFRPFSMLCFERCRKCAYFAEFVGLQ